MTKAVIVSKSNKNAEESTNPNDFIFHSNFNTFKIISTGKFTLSLEKTTISEGSITQAHGKSYIPFMFFFWKDESGEVHLPGGYSNDNELHLDTVLVDNTNITVWYFNTGSNNYSIDLRYYEFEIPL